MNVEQFEDFIFAGSKTASFEYKSFLRGLKPPSPPTGVFTHGDVRPANVIVSQREDSTWRVEAMIDWEDSGFYPDYWECVKMTNNLTPRDTEDWYLYLPRSCSPHQYGLQWSIDKILDRSLENS
jgi:thiamine kinase-like enzyme